MKDFHPFWCMMLGDQAGLRVSDRACIAIHRAIKYVAVLGYDVNDISSFGKVGTWRIQRGLRCVLRQEEDEDTTSAEYVSIILRYQKKRIIADGDVENILQWMNVQFDQGRLREQYRWPMVRDLLPWPDHHRRHNRHD